MKKFLLVLALISFGFTAIKAQTAPPPAPAAPATTKAAKAKVAATDVPDAVKNKFAADYPTIKDAKWQMSGKTDFAASYKEGGKKRRIVYTPDGTMRSSKIEIDPSALPPSVNDYVTKNLAGQKITNVNQITEKGKTWYSVKVGDKASGGSSLKFDSNGNFVAPKEHKAKAPAAAPAGK
jgi:hypothetical protein